MVVPNRTFSILHFRIPKSKIYKSTLRGIIQNYLSIYSSGFLLMTLFHRYRGIKELRIAYDSKEEEEGLDHNIQAPKQVKMTDPEQGATNAEIKQILLLGSP
ncbi:hypothetical protein ABKN59_002579 [Abortiporus biennis]